MTNKEFAEKYKGRRIVLNHLAAAPEKVDGGIVIGYSPNYVWFTCNNSTIKLKDLNRNDFKLVVNNVGDCRVDGINFECLDVVNEEINKEEVEHLIQILEL